MQSTQIPVPSDNEDATRHYYERHAKTYSNLTTNIDMSAVYDRFLQYIPAKGRILDAGSGSGRDTLAFQNLDYEVEAFDASPELCKLSTQLTGVRTRLLRFQEFESAPCYDGIWACAALLHIRKAELLDAIRRLSKALKPNGAFYLSFKYGVGERVAEDGRFYMDMDEKALRELFTAFTDMKLSEIWISANAANYYGKEKWLNAIAVRALE